jgi:putative aminopeptidase FrvX
MDKIKNKIDVRFLTETLSVQSYSKDDREILVYIKNKLAQINVTVDEDSYGNIYVTKGIANDYPCLVAHVDTVHSLIEDYSVFKNGDTLFAFDGKKGKQCGIGGDDKVGVYILLQALLDIPVLKAVFFRDEEIGRIGSRFSINNHKDWYNNCNFVIEPDREGSYDLIVNSGGLEIAGDEFLSEIKEISDRYDYKDVVGVCTDVDVLTGGGIGVSCINLSCGYFNSHTSSETVSLVSVNAAYNFIIDVIAEYAHRRFDYKAPVRPAYKSSWKPKDQSFYGNLFKERQKKLDAEQLKIFGPDPITTDFGAYASDLTYDNFIFSAETKNKTKLYKYIGIKAIPFTMDVSCNDCKEYKTLFYMPYEGRVFCTKCNDFASNEEDLDLFKYLEVDDNETTFVFSVYADAWMDKSNTAWNETLKCWVPDDMPF